MLSKPVLTLIPKLPKLHRVSSQKPEDACSRIRFTSCQHPDVAGLLKIGSAHLSTESSESSGIYISARNLSLEARRQMSCNRGIIRVAQSSSFFVLAQGRGDELYKYLLLQLDCIASFDNSELRREAFSSRHILCECHHHPKCCLPLPFGHGCGGFPIVA